MPLTFSRAATRATLRNLSSGALPRSTCVASRGPASCRHSYVAFQHAAVVAHNIKRLALGRSLKAYSTGPAIMMVTMGAGDGVAQLPCCTSKGFLPKKMKSEHLFVAQFRQELGVPADSIVPKTW